MHLRIVPGESDGQGSTSKQQGKEEAEAVEEADRAGGAFRIVAEQDPAARQVARRAVAISGRAPRGR